MDGIKISEKHFQKFKELYRKNFGGEEYNKMTEHQLFDRATKLVTLMNTVVKHINKDK